ncbi:hypothetical protein [Streptomyces sp. NPDC002265]|uniref:hypothetical protein n=1 Tax=Streptomyces sp. NPDC002265 TaxID=3154415 RepID=UPI00331DA568
MALGARRRERPDRRGDEIAGRGDRAHVVEADITVPYQAAQADPATLERCERLDRVFRAWRFGARRLFQRWAVAAAAGRASAGSAFDADAVGQDRRARKNGLASRARLVPLGPSAPPTPAAAITPAPS